MTSDASSFVFLHYLTTVFDNIQDAILLIGVEPNDTYRLLMSNEGFSRGTGHPKNSVGKLVKDVVAPESYKELVKKYREVVRTKKPLEYSGWFDVPIGRQAYEIKLTPVLSALGECVQIAVITRNVTELYHLREQVEQARSALDQAQKSLRGEG